MRNRAGSSGPARRGEGFQISVPSSKSSRWTDLEALVVAASSSLMEYPSRLSEPIGPTSFSPFTPPPLVGESPRTSRTAPDPTRPAARRRRARSPAGADLRTAQGRSLGRPCVRCCSVLSFAVESGRPRARKGTTIDSLRRTRLGWLADSGRLLAAGDTTIKGDAHGYPARTKCPRRTATRRSVAATPRARWRTSTNRSRGLCAATTR